MVTDPELLERLDAAVADCVQRGLPPEIIRWRVDLVLRSMRSGVSPPPPVETLALAAAEPRCRFPWCGAPARPRSGRGPAPRYYHDNATPPVGRYCA